MATKSLSYLLFLCSCTWLLGCGQPAYQPSASELAAAAAMQAVEGAPSVPEFSIVRPFFQTSLGGNDAGETVGSAFVVNYGNPARKVALSALSVLGIGGKWQRAPLATELNSILESITLGDSFGASDGVFPAEQFVLIPEAATEPDAAHPAGDVLAMMLPQKSRLSSLPLSSHTPAVGERVWLCAALFAGAPPSQKQHAAIVIGQVSDSGNLQYQFENAQLSFEGTRGAPVLNDRGEVVAIHLSGSSVDGQPVGQGNPVTKFLPSLARALNELP